MTSSGNYRAFSWSFKLCGNPVCVIIYTQTFIAKIIHSSTVAQDYDKFWVGETSEIVRIVERSQVPPNGISTTRRPIETTTPNFVRSTSSVQRSDDRIYDGCGDTKTCFGSPDNCVASKSCQTFSAILVRGSLTWMLRDACYLAKHFLKAIVTSSSWDRQEMPDTLRSDFLKTIRWAETRSLNAWASQVPSKLTHRWQLWVTENSTRQEQES